MKPEELYTVLDVIGAAAEFNSGALDMLLRYLDKTGQRLEDLTVGELVHTINAVDRDYNRIYGRVA